MSVTSNLSLSEKTWSNQEESSAKNPARLNIHHLSLQIADFEPSGAYLDGQAALFKHQIQRQMIDFASLINETHLQFLSIFIQRAQRSPLEPQRRSEKEKQEQLEERQDKAEIHEINLAQLLAKFIALDRLELSLDGAIALRLAGDTFVPASWNRKQQRPLRWLKVQGSSWPAHSSQHGESPLRALVNLEHLDMELNELRAFPLVWLFDLPFRQASGQFLGHPSLSTLSLAKNRLKSLASDLFQGFGPRCQQASAIFRLASLTQLDLSYNQLNGLGFEEAQWIVCSMPNLNQLYLQHNRIVHLNLNSLIFSPFEPFLASPSREPDTVSSKQPPPRFWSRLEHLDVSHNRLLKLTAFQGWPNKTYVQAGRLKSLNLAANRLERPLVAINPSLVGRILFNESFDFALGRSYEHLVSLSYLEMNFDLSSFELPGSVCDATFPALGAENNPIEELILAGNELHKVEAHDFASKHCQHMLILSLSTNRISHIDHSAFNFLERLEQLDLSNNLLDQLDANVFAKNTKLISLNLSKNKLKRLRQELFSNSIHLQELMLNSNEIENLPSALFLNNKHLAALDLSKNRITQLEGGLLSSLKQLRALKLQGNLMRKFAHNLFAPDNSNQLAGQSGILPNVIRVPNIVIHQRTHQIHKVPSKFNGSLIIGRFDTQLAAPGSKRRRHRQALSSAHESPSNALVLAYNQLELFQVSSQCDHFLDGVRLLWLNGNFLRELENDTFKCTPSIVRLHLQANRLTSIDELTFQHMTNLEYLDLSNNRLASILPKLFLHSTALNHLDLARNQLNRSAFSEISRLVNLDYLDLSENRYLSTSLADLSAIICKRPTQSVNLGGIESLYYSESDNITSLTDKLYIDSLNLSSISEINEFVYTLLQGSMIDIYKLDLSSANLDLGAGSKKRNFILNKLQNSELSELSLTGSQLRDEDIHSLFRELTYSSKLSRLDLQSNLLRSWPFNAKTAQRMLALRSINLASNQMRYLISGEELISYEFEHLESLNASSNSMVAIFDESASSLNSHRALSSFMPKLRRIDLSQNRITWFPGNLLEGLLELELIKLNHNQLQALPHLPGSQRLAADFSHNYQLFSSRLDYSGPTNKRSALKMPEDLIITNDPFSYLPQIQCHTHRMQRASPTGSSSQVDDDALADDDLLREWSEPMSAGISQYEYQLGFDGEICSELMDQIDSVRLDSFSSHDTLELGLIGPSGDVRPVSLSVRNSGLISLNSSVLNPNVISLDLDRNKIHTISESICARLVQLFSLNLSRNQLNELKSSTFAHCGHLKYLDLSMNKIKVWSKPDGPTEFDELVVLKLNNNLLSSLPNIDAQYLRSLRVLDLRSNRLTEVSLLPHLDNLDGITIITELLPAILIDRESSRFYLKSTSGALLISQAEREKEGENLTIKVSQDNHGEHSLALPSAKSGSIKYCTLEKNNRAKVCLERNSLKRNPTSKCFYLQAPSNISTCMTELLQRQPELANVTSSNSSLLSLASHKEQNTDSSTSERDVVLNIIESLRMNWLKFKDMNFNEFIIYVSNIKSDTTWSTPDGRLRLNTLTALKLAIIGGAVCIILLLIATFYLFTYLSGQSERRKVNDQLREAKSDDDSSNTTKWCSSSESCTSDNRAPGNKSLQGSETCSSLINQSKSSSTSHQEDMDLPTVLDRSKTFSQLNPIQLFNQQCSTPSSSLAPSSVETGETMNAVESMQSNNSSLHHAHQNQYSTSVDNYAEEAVSTLRRESNYHPVATVMRLVKSNSANFSANQNQQHQRSASISQAYGTLGCRGQNYPALKSRLQPVQGLTSGHYKPATVLYQLDEHAYDADMTPSALAHGSLDNSSCIYQHDPSTLSLLSINTALSSGQIRSPASQQVSPSSTVTLNELPSGELCQYHGRQHYEKSSGPNIIVEVDEEQFQYATNLPPPPPAIRSFEVLQANESMLLKSDVQNCNRK